MNTNMNTKLALGIIVKPDDRESELLDRLLGGDLSGISDKQKKVAKVKPDDLTISFDKDEDESHLLEGWSDYEKGARWVEGRSAKVQFAIDKANPKKITITAEALYKSQITKVYVNDTYIGMMKIKSGETNEYILNIKDSLKKGVNTITFQFSHAQRIGELTNANDIRLLSTYMKSIKLN